MKTPHAFAPVFYCGIECDRCEVCARYRSHPNHIQTETLPGMENADTEREAAKKLATAAELSAELLRPLGNINKKSGKMERESPLFYGLGGNPILF